MNHRILRPIAAALLLLPLAAPVTAQWGPIQPPNQPSGRAGALMGYDLPGNRMLMFGGNYSNEFWVLQNGAWSQLQPNPIPSGRRDADMAVDSITGNVLLYGGLGGTQYALDETWQWNGTAWSQVTTSPSPGGLFDHSMAYDIFRQVTVMVGGRNDSWNLNLHAVGTWEFSNGNWSIASPATSVPARAKAAMSFHPGLGEIMLFGGEDAIGIGLDDTWSYDGATWTQINLTGARPAGRAGARLVPVLSRNICVLFGGVDPMTQQITNDTWEHDGVDWRQVVGSHGSLLPARHSFSMAHDLVRDRIVAFGGKTSNNALRNDTWEYGAHWRRFGVGCAGAAGVPSFDGGALPQMGQTCDAQLTNLPQTSSLAFVAVGLSRQQWAFGSLPTLLDNFGMPGCRAYTSADVLTAVAVSAGVGSWSWNVPTSLSFLGQEFYLQGLVPDPGANASGLTVSNAATLVIGW